MWERPGVRVEDVGETGWLALPEAAGPVPAVLVLHPSGAPDRRGLVPAQVTGTGQDVYLFDDLVAALTGAGVAVLGFDCQFVTARREDGWIPGEVTFTGLAEEAARMLAYLRSHPKVDAQRVSLLGISLGTVVAAAVASRDHEPGRLILASPCVLTNDEHLSWTMVGRRLEWLLRAGMVDGDETIDLDRVAAQRTARSGWWDDFDPADYAEDGASVIGYERLAARLWQRHDQFRAALLSVDDDDAPAEYWVTRAAQPRMTELLAGVRGQARVHVGEQDVTTPARHSYLLASSASPDLDVRVTVHAGLGHLLSPRNAAGELTYGPIAPSALAALAQDALAQDALA